MKPRAVQLLVCLAIPLSTSCQDGHDPTAPEQLNVAHDVTVLFNPQPEPPREMSFELSGQLGGTWFGSFAYRAGKGALTVETTSLSRRGETVYLRQTWRLYPPDPIKPLILEVSGSLDLANGRLQLSGATADGSSIEVLANTVVSANGKLSAGGELMFNPQPEPPRVRLPN